VQVCPVPGCAGTPPAPKGFRKQETRSTFVSLSDKDRLQSDRQMRLVEGGADPDVEAENGSGRATHGIRHEMERLARGGAPPAAVRRGVATVHGERAE
jgi:hypothetical protein